MTDLIKRLREQAAYIRSISAPRYKDKAAEMYAQSADALEAAKNRIADLEAQIAAADGGRKDAERYRWLAERFTGYDFNWMPSSENAADGKSVAVFDIGRGFRGGRDFTAALDAVLTAATAKQPQDKP